MSQIKLDVLAFGAHPDDVEISAGGTVAQLVDSGKKVGIIDLTRGELGSRGSAELRDQEAQAASDILRLSLRRNLALRDGFFEHNEAAVMAIINCMRLYQPEFILANSIRDRHPDHGKGGKLVAEAAFLSGLRKIETKHQGQLLDPWRPKAVYHYIQDYYLEPDVVTDVSDYFEQKMKAIKAYRSQFHIPGSNEPETPISGREFFDFLKARALQFGRPIGALYGEGFNVTRYLGVRSLSDLL